ncbi:MAG: hypothetical protein ACRDRG_16600 [Pseudonocardiaceae bacterium]
MRVAVAAAAMLLASACDAAVPFAIGCLVDHVIARPEVAISRLAVGYLALIAGVLLGSRLLQYCLRHLVENVSTAYERDTRTDELTTLLRLGK